MEEEVSVSALPWCWIIETLARSRQMGAPILYALLSKAPPLLGKPGKEAREAVALRCLEEFFGHSTGPVDEHPASHPSKSRFDTSDSFEDVLQRLLDASSGSDLRKDMSDELKWDVCSFIKLKKASLPICSLELLQSVIVEGSHPLAAYLKELRELALPNQSMLNVPSNGVDSASTLPTLNENCNFGQAVLAEEYGDSSKHGTSDQLGQASLPNANLPYSEKDKSNDQVQDIDDTTCDLDNHDPPVKKLKLDKQEDLQSEQQPSVPCDGSDIPYAAKDGQNHQCSKASDSHKGKPNGDNSGDIGENNIYSVNQPRTSHDKDVDHPRETDLARKMLAFFSSQSIVPDDSPAMTETEVNLCMKCNKGGELLICGANTCPLAFHESCLGCSTSFDDQGKFYCPFCTYSRAISEYVRAKEKVSLARKELSQFMGGKISSQAEPDSTTELGGDVEQQRQKEDINKTTERKNDVNVATEVPNPRQLRSSENKRQTVTASPASMAENAFVAAAQNFTSQDREGAEIMAQLARDTIRILNQGQDGHHSDGGNPSLGKERIINTSLKSPGRKRKKEATGHQATDLHADVGSDSISDFDGLSEDEKNRTNTTILSPMPLREVPLAYRSRRKKVPWTAEEEAILKEGVQKFVSGDNRAVPWKSILEFGGSVFQQGRTAIDLKDKWRNIMRGSPKPK